MSKTLVFFEHEGQVRDYFGRFEEQGGYVFIAMTPFAAYGLDELGIDHRIPEDYYKLEEAYNIGIENYSRIGKMCDIIDGHIHERCHSVAEKKLRPAFFSFYNIKLAYDTAVIALFRLSRIIAAERPTRLIVYGSKKYPVGPELVFDNRESVYGRLLHQISHGAEVEVLPPVEPLRDFHSGHRARMEETREGLKSRLQSHEMLFNIFANVKKDGVSGLFKNLRKKTGRAVILFGGAYNWDYCRDEFRKNGITNIVWMREGSVRWPEAKEQRLDLAGVWAKLKDNDDFRNLFLFERIDLFPLFEERLAYLVERLTVLCEESYKLSGERIRKENACLFLASTLPGCIAKSAAQASRDLGVPVVLWQHGSYGYMDHPMIPYTDMMGADYLFLYGQSVLEKYKKEGQKFGAKLMPVGSATLDSIAKSVAGAKNKTVLYVTTNFYQNATYVAIPPFFSDNLFWRSQKKILDVLGKHRDYKMIVKVHSNPKYRESPMRAYADMNGLKNFTFMRNERSFRELLPLAGIIVIDFPSTTLLEALTTSKPIFTTTQYLKMDSRAEKLLKKRAFCYATAAELAAEVDSFLSTRDSGGDIDLDNREFLKNYGTYLDDGKSAQRAVSFLTSCRVSAKLS